MIMLAVAAGYAEAHEIPEIFYAAHKNDATIYPDCRAEFVEALRPAIRLATAWQPGRAAGTFRGPDQGRDREDGSGIASSVRAYLVLLQRRGAALSILPHLHRT